MHTQSVGGRRVAPDDRVVTGERTRRVVRGTDHRPLAAAGQVDERTGLQDLVGAQDVGLDAVGEVQQGLVPLDLQGVGAVAQVELALRAELDVEVEVP